MNTSAAPHAYQLQTFGTLAASLMSCTLQPLNPALLKVWMPLQATGRWCCERDFGSQVQDD